MRQKYDSDIHTLFGEYLKKIDVKNVVVISYECRMGFGESYLKMKLIWERAIKLVERIQFKEQPKLRWIKMISQDFVGSKTIVVL